LLKSCTIQPAPTRRPLKESNSLNRKSIIHRHLDPGDTLGEVLFGLIMVLTFTVGERLLPSESLDTHALVVGAVGCNIAWGIIDAALFLLGTLYYRSRRARYFRTLKGAGSEAEALAAVSEEFGLEDEPLAVQAEDQARLHQAISVLAAHSRVVRARLTGGDLAAALVIFFLVSATAIPGVVPFLLLGNSYLALRVSNAVLLLLLFGVGHWWGHYTDAKPWKVGSAVALLGLSMVLVAVALGG
jgi:VIT family protein